ncbi:MAG: helix-turn-helix domain-containing protein [Enterococcus sp.]
MVRAIDPVLVPYPIIREAIKGDPQAIQFVLAFYKGYMLRLSLRVVLDDQRKRSKKVDVFMYRRLESKLTEKIVKYRII